MSKMHDNLNKILDVEDTEYTGETIHVIDPNQKALPPPVSNSEPVVSDKDTQSDYEKARESMRNVIDMAEEAAGDLLSLAKETEKSRDFEVLSTMLNTIKDTAKELMLNQKVKRDLIGLPDGTKKIMEQPGISVDKAIFVGTLAEFQEQRKLKKNE